MGVCKLEKKKDRLRGKFVMVFPKRRNSVQSRRFLVNGNKLKTKVMTRMIGRKRRLIGDYS